MLYIVSFTDFQEPAGCHPYRALALGDPRGARDLGHAYVSLRLVFSRSTSACSMHEVPRASLQSTVKRGLGIFDRMLASPYCPAIGMAMCFDPQAGLLTNIQSVNFKTSAIEAIDALTASAQIVVQMLCSSVTSRVVASTNRSKRLALNPTM